jgi:hypothetical protein
MAKTTEWCDEIDWKAFLEEFYDICCTIFTKPVIDELTRDYNEKFTIPKDVYQPEERLKTLLKYGINKGVWDDLTMRSFRDGLTENFDSLMKPFKMDFEYQPLKDRTWNEAVEIYPPITMFRMGATTCFPDFVKQSPKTILERIDDAKKNFKLSKIVVNYGRQQGGKRDLTTLKVELKNRQVFGTEFDSKAHGIDFTYESKLHGIPNCAYYKPWEMVFKDLISTYDKGIWIAGDWSGYDQSFNRKVLDVVYDVWRGFVPGHRLKQFDSLWSIMFGPSMMWNGFYISEFRRGMSLSGNPLVPMFETISNVALHEMHEGFKTVVTKMNVQIDDIVFQVEGKFDSEDFYDSHKKTGFRGNPNKIVRSDIQGHATYLNVDFGRIFSTIVETLAMGTCDPDTVVFLSRLYEKLKGLHDRERINTSYGEIVIVEETETGKLQETDKDISRFLGIVGSFGPYMPILLLDCIIRHFLHTDMFKRLRQKIYNLKVVKSDYGFSPKSLILWMQNNLNHYP